jgi:hypothetical protein
MAEQNGSVTFTVKELLARIEGKIDALTVTLALKADRTDVADLNQRVTKLELGGAGDTGAREWLWRAVMALPGIAALAAYLQH